VKTGRAWLVYSVLRLALFLVPFLILFGIGKLLPGTKLTWYVAALLAAVIGFALSMVVLRRQRDAVSIAVSDWREGKNVPAPANGADEDEEDRLVDDASVTNEAPTPASDDAVADSPRTDRRDG
jgi:Protein of unknown function (DUF4229)